MQLKDVKPNPSNPRIIKDGAFEKLCESIKRDPEFMAIRPIVVDDNGVILGGNMRYRAIQHLGMKEIPDDWVVKASNLTEEQQRRFILVDNAPRGMAGEWDFDMLANDWEIPELEAVGINIYEMMHKEHPIDLEQLFEEKVESSGEPSKVMCPQCGEAVDV